MPRKATKRPLSPHEATEAELQNLDHAEYLEERRISAEAAKLDREFLKAEKAFLSARKKHGRKADALVRAKTRLNKRTARRRAILEARLAAL